MSCRWKHLEDQHICVTWELPWRFQASSKFWWAVPQWPMGEEGPCQMACFSARSPAVYSFLWWSWSWLHCYLQPDNGNQMSLLNQAGKRVVIKNRALSPLTHHYLRGSPSLKLKDLNQTQESHTWWWYFCSSHENASVGYSLRLTKENAIGVTRNTLGKGPQNYWKSHCLPNSDSNSEQHSSVVGTSFRSSTGFRRL